MHLLQNLVDVGGVGVDLGGLSLLLVVSGILHGSLLVLSSRHGYEFERICDSNETEKAGGKHRFRETQ